MAIPVVDTQPFVIVLPYRVHARNRSEAMELLVKYQSDAQFMIEQDLRKHRGSQVVDLLDCDVKPSVEARATAPNPDSEIDAATQAFVTAAIAWRKHVNLVPVNPLTQEMLDKLDALVILRGHVNAQRVEEVP